MRIETEHLTGPGEIAVDNAPVLRRPDSSQCIPQHFLRYEHSLETVEALAAGISYDQRYPIFVSQDGAGIFIQIGIVGPDNYKAVQDKLVYGRRWRVEPNLPTSEIIQTMFLALKKAREHELREIFTVSWNGHKTTPFNGHHDLPYICRHGASFISSPDLALNDIIKAVRYDGTKFLVASEIALPSGQTVITLSPRTQSTREFAKLCNGGLSFICDDLHPTTVLHAMFEACLKTSDRHIEENFLYDDFARFSHTVDILKIAEFSADVRQCPSNYLPKTTASDFIHQLKSQNYETDQTRIPRLMDNDYNQRISSQLQSLDVQPPPRTL